MPELSDPNPTLLKIPAESGKAPDSRIINAYQVWETCRELDNQDERRSKKRTRIYKAYNRFPPTEYSTLVKLKQDWNSNVGFGMLAYVVDNNHSSFFDMVTERVWAADIQTKIGSPLERAEYSDHISFAFNKVIREWDEFLLNVEQDLLDMLLFGKGVEMWEDEEGCFTEHIPADDCLIPDGTKIGLKNFDVFAVKRRYSLHELWKKVEKNDGEKRGWDKKNVLTAMRMQRKAWKDKYKTNEAFTKDVAEGNIMLSGAIKETVDTYMLFVKQFNGKIGKYIVMRDYEPALSLTRASQRVKTDDEKQLEIRSTIKKEGFLFHRDDYAECVADVIAVFTDCGGAGTWHRITSLAEKIFVQCRQYDITMNAIMDAVKLNMSLMLQAQTPEASEKIKALVFGPFTIIPSDIPFVQQRLALPTQEATAAVQFMMLDMFRGIGEYRVSERGQQGQPVTATQNANDTAEAAKLSGTQLKRFNEQHTIYYRKIFEKLMSLGAGEKDYEHFKKFKDHMEANKVPPEAYAYKNIQSITSNMLAGAGSPAFKLMAAKETIALTNITPKDAGQANAIRDGIAALQGRSNVDRYFAQMKPDKTWNEQKAGWENEMLASPLANPDDVQVMPDDNHPKHINTHLSDMERTIILVNERLDKHAVSEAMGEIAAFKMLNVGAHTMAHIQMLSRDKSKQSIVSMAMERMGQIQKDADDLAKKLQAEKKHKKSAQFDPSSDPDIQKKIAMGQLEVTTKEKLATIKIAAIATGHEQRQQIAEDKAASDIAINRAKELDKLETKKRAEKKVKATA